MNIKRLKRHLQSTIWPHRHNSWHPYLLRAPALAFATAGVASLLFISNLGEGPGNLLGVAENVTAADIIRTSNEARVKAGVEPLAINEDLNKAAIAKAESMFAADYWDHYGPNGETPWDFLRVNDYKYTVAGENLAKDFQTSRGVIEGWLGSPQHRGNLLSEEYEEMGVAAVDGVLNGRETTLVVAFYARPSTFGGPVIASNTGEGDLLPARVNYSVINPLNTMATMPLASQIIGLLLLGFGSLFMVQHIVIRNQHLLWDKHIHPHPLLQGVILIGFAVMLAQASFGVVG